MNIFSNLMNNTGDWIAGKLAPYINDALGVRYQILGNYYEGNHRPQLKRKDGQPDDNIMQNYVGLATNRSISRLFRGGLKFVLPDGADEQQEYLDKVWDLNKKEILLMQVGLHGATYGTPYIKICPDELQEPYTGEWYPRLIPIDPEIVRIRTDAADMNEVEEYRIEYKTKQIDEAGGVREIGHRELTKRIEAPEVKGDYEPKPDSWVIEEWEQGTIYGNIWTLVSSTPWEYDFPPIIHWKNLPSLKSCYGNDDESDGINIQDKSNFVVSNTGKIIKFYAHPETIMTGASVGDLKEVPSSVGVLRAISNPEAKVYNLEMGSDLASSRAFALDLRQSIFDVAREVDISSMADKLGALTNFGLQVLWSDAMDKTNTKRQLYGDAILELNRRLLVLADYTMEASNPGTLQWGDPLPVNIMEEMTADEKALSMGVVDKETVAKRYESRYGKKWEDIKAALEEQQAADNKNNANIGAEILKRFSQGGGVEMPTKQGIMNQQKEMINGNKPNTTR